VTGRCSDEANRPIREEDLVAAPTDAWWDRPASWPNHPRKPEDEDQSTDPDPADSDGYEPI
jgi:hypothetical protein